MRFLFALIFLIVLSVCQAQEKTVTIGLIGDSTVAEQSGWGPAFAERFDRRATILNYAKSGATLQALSKKLDELVQHQPDYVLIQFGHHDQKRYDTTVYHDHLKSYVERIQKAGAAPLISGKANEQRYALYELDNDPGESHNPFCPNSNQGLRSSMRPAIE